MSQKTSLKLDWATYEAAKFACENWHYSKCVPKSKQNRIGVWEDGKFIGVILIGNSSGSTVFNFLGLDQFSAAELTRVALNRHKTQVSRLIKIAVMMVKKLNPKLKALVSFADANEGHHGGIYQAGNWKYFGTSTPQKQYYFRGKWRNDMKLMQLFKGRREEMRKLKTRNIVGKHKYVLFLDKGMESFFKNQFKSFPKRVSSIDSDASDLRSEQGGANPTDTLQFKAGAING